MVKTLIILPYYSQMDLAATAEAAAVAAYEAAVARAKEGAPPPKPQPKLRPPQQRALAIISRQTNCTIFCRGRLFSCAAPALEDRLPRTLRYREPAGSACTAQPPRGLWLAANTPVGAVVIMLAPRFPLPPSSHSHSSSRLGLHHGGSPARGTRIFHTSRSGCASRRPPSAACPAVAGGSRMWPNLTLPWVRARNEAPNREAA